MSAAGIGKLSPNVMMLGFMHSWKERAVDDMVSYYNMIHDAFTYNYGVVILNAPKGKLSGETRVAQYHIYNFSVAQLGLFSGRTRVG